MKIAVITGASAGIGREFVYAVDRQYELDEIWVVARRKERLEELSASCKTPLRAVCLDLSKLDSVDEYAAMLDAEKPEISILVNAAGCGVFGPFAENDLKTALEIIKND